MGKACQDDLRRGGGQAERALARAREAWDRDEHADAIRHFEMAWEHARRAMRLAIR